MIDLEKATHSLTQFVSERFPVEKLNFHSMVEKKEVPIHRMSWGYYTGGLTMFFFMIQVVTGLFLLFYYQPTVSDAHVSVEYISHHVSGGALFRNMHAWSSSCMIFFAMVRNESARYRGSCSTVRPIQSTSSRTPRIPRPGVSDVPASPCAPTWAA